VSATAGLDEPRHCPDDTFVLGGIASGLSHVHQVFLESGGTGILNGDGALSYGWENVLEALLKEMQPRSLRWMRKAGPLTSFERQPSLSQTGRLPNNSDNVNIAKSRGITQNRSIDVQADRAAL
jgi:hypothetical protein